MDLARCVAAPGIRAAAGGKLLAAIACSTIACDEFEARYGDSLLAVVATCATGLHYPHVNRIVISCRALYRRIGRLLVTRRRPSVRKPWRRPEAFLRGASRPARWMTATRSSCGLCVRRCECAASPRTPCSGRAYGKASTSARPPATPLTPCARATPRVRARSSTAPSRRRRRAVRSHPPGHDRPPSRSAPDFGPSYTHQVYLYAEPATVTCLSRRAYRPVLRATKRALAEPSKCPASPRLSGDSHAAHTARPIPRCCHDLAREAADRRPRSCPRRIDGMRRSCADPNGTPGRPASLKSMPRCGSERCASGWNSSSRRSATRRRGRLSGLAGVRDRADRRREERLKAAANGVLGHLTEGSRQAGPPPCSRPDRGQLRSSRRSTRASPRGSEHARRDHRGLG